MTVLHVNLVHVRLMQVKETNRLIIASIDVRDHIKIATIYQAAVELFVKEAWGQIRTFKSQYHWWQNSIK